MSHPRFFPVDAARGALRGRSRRSAQVSSARRQESSRMDNQHLCDDLLQAAEKLGVEVRIEPFETPATMGGGLCVVRGEKLVLIDQSVSLPDRILVLARALAELESETVYLAPEARELIEAIQGNRNPHIE